MSKPAKPFDDPAPALKARGLPHFALSAIALGLLGLGLAAATSDAQFARGLEQALAETPETPATALASQHSSLSAVAAPVAGSEAFWLNSDRVSIPLQPATWQAHWPVPGDRFKFGGTAQRVLEVTDVRQIAAPAQTTGAEDKASAQLLLVTLRDVARPDTAGVRMLFDANAPIAGLIPLGREPHADL